MKKDLNTNMDFKNILSNEAKAIGLLLTPLMLDRFEKYKELLIEWNKKMNLTNIVDEYEIIIKHYIDCLEIVKNIDPKSKVIDIGTGAGFPGIVIAIYFDLNIEITLLDSLNKRLNFLREVVGKLELNSVEIIHARAEEYGNKQEYRENYDVVVSRAVASLPVLLEIDSPYIKIGGKCLFMKSENVEEELKSSIIALKKLNLKFIEKYEYELVINEEVFIRNILEIKKINNTPNKYPRAYGKIKKKAL